MSMKKIILLASMLGISTLLPAEKANPKPFVHIMSARMDVFYFKLEKEFLGAQLDIYSEDGVTLFSQTIDHRKVLIDFYFENAGKFIIHFEKGNFQEEFNFIKKDPCVEDDKPTQLIKVVQGI
jgi:hypothetical protein